MRNIYFLRGVYYAQAKGVWGLLHIGQTAILLFPGYRGWPLGGWRLELFTHFRKFRFSRRGW